MENKWYVDEIYHACFRLPMWLGAQILSFGDRHFLDGVMVDGLAKLPVAVGKVFKPLYGGALQGYAATMAGGIALVVAWLSWVWLRGFN
jgi:NADH:ubiquinone oxidoreductase subunit 5 (subunit L)/multisubunit Na+/H+ antiporter MnhA subunit